MKKKLAKKDWLYMSVCEIGAFRPGGSEANPYIKFWLEIVPISLAVIELIQR